MQVIETDRFFYIELSEYESSYIHSAEYDTEQREMTISFRYGRDIVYVDVPSKVFNEFLLAPSKGKFYNSNIKSQFKTQIMPRFDLELTGSIDLRKIDKDILLEASKPAKDGHTPLYCNVKILYTEKPDQFGQNGFIAQATPKALRANNPEGKQPVLGNVKNWDAYTDQRKEMASEKPDEGKEFEYDDASDDLPF